MITTKEEKNNPIIIFGSSRSEGNTLLAIKAITKDQSVPIIDLSELNIGYYDYKYENAKDDFLPLAEKMVSHDPIILATPVYWYTMSALMKTFLDRWTDLLYIRKDIGRNLTNKRLYLIASYAADSLPKGFEDPFSQTCEYLKIDYKGCLYFHSGVNEELRQKNNLLADHFFDQIFNQTAPLNK